MDLNLEFDVIEDDVEIIEIIDVGGNDAEVFRNRKQYFSINVQAVTDAKKRFVDIVARWPGSSHDATIFNASRLKAKFEEGQYNNCVLLGDSAYNLRRFLLTPFLNPAGNSQQRYNESHIRTRVTVVNMFGIWKRRFPVMAYGCRLKLENVLLVIVATAVLHNVAQNMGEEEPPVDNVHQVDNLINEGYINEVNNNEANIGNIREQLVINYFANL
ncbi:hypothetical protein MML48_8g00014968 [Holotrichia oblita]|uniref:Uncharacterized protein n=1 Tax=Holotrichia oblita TaxID=644536 RepID=A0ACB9SLB7_HOLOL|nr:hypothetical protein MML48_8g00014968 [Holotrichia oblita]